MLNVRRLQAVRREILAHPEEFDMADWCSATLRRTKRCVAGRTVAMFGTPIQRFWRGRLDIGLDSTDVCEQACELLDIGYPEARGLFYVDRWPLIFRSQLQMSRTAGERAETVGLLIEYFISMHSDEGWLRPVAAYAAPVVRS